MPTPTVATCQHRCHCLDLVVASVSYSLCPHCLANALLSSIPATIERHCHHQTPPPNATVESKLKVTHVAGLFSSLVITCDYTREKHQKNNTIKDFLFLSQILFGVGVRGVNPTLPEMGYMSNLFCLLIGSGHVENM
jgi:hypothetical protein